MGLANLYEVLASSNKYWKKETGEEYHPLSRSILDREIVFNPLLRRAVYGGDLCAYEKGAARISLEKSFDQLLWRKQKRMHRFFSLADENDRKAIGYLDHLVGNNNFLNNYYLNLNRASFLELWEASFRGIPVLELKERCQYLDQMINSCFPLPDIK